MRNALAIIMLASLASCDQVNLDEMPAEKILAGTTVNIHQKPGGDFSRPDSAGWREVQSFSSALSLAPPVHASINLRHDTTVPAIPIEFRVASDGTRYYFRLHWKDASENLLTNRSKFADAVAVQFALGGGESTSFMMGASGAPVNIWYWKAGQVDPENLAAAGFGSTTALLQGNLEATSTYDTNGSWTVVLSRPIKSNADHQVDLSKETVQISLALWQGETGQRDGLKYVVMGWIALTRDH